MKAIIILFILALAVSTFASPIPYSDEDSDHHQDDYHNNKFLHVTSPVGEVTWLVGSTQEITFFSNELANETIEVFLFRSDDEDHPVIVLSHGVSVGTGVVNFNVPFIVPSSLVSHDYTYFVQFVGSYLKVRSGTITITEVDH
ncbi:hypothetical protein BC938DRAFT_483165 [Jimgerdemannia flammicorona]|uniref:Uncharacterized protein n=1 Tax=Jimgerdemannia flammicorona TaxID=994334 RepID=A0A433QCF9_9FUNG|nr:hypothetical protein BC938DRAFT_483165 [Jimgerdemannia flammicorona]